MIAALIISATFVAQAPPPLLARPTAAQSAGRAAYANSEIGRTIQKRREAASRKRTSRVNRAIQDRYEAEEARIFQERMAPLMLQQQANQATQYYQQQSGQAMENIGIAARQDAETRRLRAIGQFGPGYFINPPRVVTPSEVIQSQLGPR